MKDDFLKIISENPTDYVHRNIYADWLDEHGEHEEADRQRKYEASDKWMIDFASQHSSGGDEWYGPFHQYTKDDLLEAAMSALEAEREGDWWNGLVQQGSDSLRDALWEEETRNKFWEHFSILTGYSLAEEEKKNVTPFSCSC